MCCLRKMKHKIKLINQHNLSKLNRHRKPFNLKRCPKGTHRDEKGNCVPKDQPKPKQPSPIPSPKKDI